MKKAMVFAFFVLFSLFWVGLVTGLQAFEPWDRILADKPGNPPLAPGEMSWNAYKKTKLALGSFDLVNGLTKHDLETLHVHNNLGFYYLVGCLWLVLGLRLCKRPRKE